MADHPARKPLTRPPADAAGPRWRPRLLGALALAVLMAVFAAYLSPHLAVDLANRLWACF